VNSELSDELSAL